MKASKLISNVDDASILNTKQTSSLNSISVVTVSRSLFKFDSTSILNTEQMSSLKSISAVKASRPLPKFDGTTISNTKPISSLNDISSANTGGSLQMPSSTSAFDLTECGRPNEHHKRELTLRYDVLTSSSTMNQVGKRLQIG